MLEYLSKVQFSSICVIFTIIIIGYYLGKIKVSGISLDLSGVLIVAIIYGAIVRPENKSFLQNMKFLTSLGTSLFISVIGITSGYGFSKYMKRKTMLCLFIGINVILINIFVMLLLLRLDKAITPETMYGIFCGALTSTPGLSTVCEASDSFAAAATSGYGCSYIFGVIGAVLFVQIASKFDETKIKISKPESTYKNTIPTLTGLILIAVAIVTGTILGGIKLPFIKITLGSSCGILCAGLISGWLMSVKYPCFFLGQGQAETIRELGLMLFFVGTGIPAGSHLLTQFNVVFLVYGIVLTVIPVIVSFLISDKLIKNSLPTTLSIVAGVMTSTPAIGVLSRKKTLSPDTTAYSITYTGALIAMIIYMRIITTI